MKINKLFNPLFDVIGIISDDNEIDVYFTEKKYIFKLKKDESTNRICSELINIKSIHMESSKINSKNDFLSILNTEFIKKVKLLGLKNNNKLFTEKMFTDKMKNNHFSSLNIITYLSELSEYIGINKKSNGFILMNEKTYNDIMKIISDIDLKSLNLEINETDILENNELIIGRKKDGLVAGIKIYNNKVDFKTDNFFHYFITETSLYSYENYYTVNITDNLNKWLNEKYYKNLTRTQIEDMKANFDSSIL